ncbi:mannan endo-1,4-beta-mannosidase [Chitinophaga rupis]|uniref:Mannan endo-1,4-beta-mannosidase n=1 Tax=Chitinophaga rupis TaxID=573321 RepID=A0A1H7SXR5_9BACT|nr:glycosyl hydrolase [Chitinophaga rupis]SEL77049.1 mannan endo-1,4-beta-mannosidase [Chitinophaga rupis]
MKHIFLALLLTPFILHAQSDPQATPAAKQLHQRLYKLMQRGIMFGHQDDLAYGVGWKYEHGRSDVRSVCGDGPAVYGWDLGHLELGRSHNLDSVPFDSLRSYIRTVYESGGINTLSWHGNNPATGGSAWDTSLAVTAILPGGSSSATYTAWLDKLADFMLSLKAGDGTLIPVIFRPFHEHTGSWFWWGQHQCTSMEFRTLWQYTVNYLQIQKHVHNLLFAYSAADFNNEKDYLERWPGDDFVDIIGFDLYQSGSAANYQHLLRERLHVLQEIAAAHGMIPALTETGLERIPEASWWTQTLLPVLQNYKLSYVLVWRNGRPDHYYAPYPGQASAEDFKKFHANEHTLFLEEAKSIKDKAESPTLKAESIKQKVKS